MDDTGTDRSGSSAGMERLQSGRANEPGDKLGLAVGVAHVRSIALLGQLEAARFAIDELIYNFDRVPESYQLGCPIRRMHDDLTAACGTITDAYASWVGE